MADSKTFWLTVTNIALGLALIVLILGVLTGVVCEYVGKVRRRHALRRELERDVQRFLDDAWSRRRPRA